MRRWAAVAALAALLAASLALPAGAASSVDRVDAWIRSGTAAKVGLGIVTGDGTNQTKTRRIPAGRSVTFTIGASRHGSGTGTVEFVGSARRDEMYRLPDGTDIT